MGRAWLESGGTVMAKERDVDTYSHPVSDSTIICREDEVTLPGGHVFSADIIMSAAHSYRRSAVERGWKTTNGSGRKIAISAPRGAVGND